MKERNVKNIILLDLKKNLEYLELLFNVIDQLLNKWIEEERKIKYECFKFIHDHIYAFARNIRKIKANLEIVENEISS